MAVNAGPKVRHFKAKLALQHLLLKVLQFAVSRPFRDPEGSCVGGVSYGPVSVTWQRCGVDWGGPGGHHRCAAVHHSTGAVEKKERKVHFLLCCVSFP